MTSTAPARLTYAQRPRLAHPTPPVTCSCSHARVQDTLPMCAGDEFFFTITETFWPDRSDAFHPLTFSTEPPVMASCIKATGSHWVR